MTSEGSNYLIPEWPAPNRVRSAITLREGGHSQAPFDSYNLADHVSDNPRAVLANRQQLRQDLDLPSEPVWLNQVHGTQVVNACEVQGTPDADASFADQVNKVCVVLTADCLPVLFCNQQGTQVAAAHAGWRGLCGGVLRQTLAQFSADDKVLAYLGPAIGPQVFEVGDEVYQAFCDGAQNSEHKRLIKAAFRPVQSVAGVKRYIADLYALARAELRCCGVVSVYGGDYCSYSQPGQFFSYRRDQKTGRNASLIWLQDSELNPDFDLGLRC